MAIAEINNGLFRLGVAPALGGSIAYARWRHPSGREVELMRPGDAERIDVKPSDLAAFPMVPFANRIDRGRIPLPDGSIVIVPVNRPAQHAAIHGFAREAPWEVAAHSPTHIELEQEYGVPDNTAYSYAARQSFTLLPDAIDCEIAVTNRGERVLPFGIGLHPWFERTRQTRLSVAARWAFRMDDRDMPLESVPLASVTGGSEFTVLERAPFDTPLAAWDGVALIQWPERRTGLRIEARGALRLVHIYAPGEKDVLCVEPVSHLPDVVNRRHLAPLGDMAWLPPLGSLAGGIRLRPLAID